MKKIVTLGILMICLLVAVRMTTFANAESIEEVTVINFGTQIATGAPESIQSNPDVIAAYLGENES